MNARVAAQLRAGFGFLLSRRVRSASRREERSGGRPRACSCLNVKSLLRLLYSNGEESHRPRDRGANVVGATRANKRGRGRRLFFAKRGATGKTPCSPRSSSGPIASNYRDTRWFKFNATARRFQIIIRIALPFFRGTTFHGSVPVVRAREIERDDRYLRAVGVSRELHVRRPQLERALIVTDDRGTDRIYAIARSSAPVA